jgi:hypothetical protein
MATADGDNLDVMPANRREASSVAIAGSIGGQIGSVHYITRTGDALARAMTPSCPAVSRPRQARCQRDRANWQGRKV